MKREIEIVARGVCVREGHLLVCVPRRGGYVYLPGGHVEFGEPAARALEREIAEELGRPGRAGRFLGAAEHTFVAGGRRSAEIDLVFELRMRGVRPPVAPPSRERGIAFRWIPLGGLPRSGLEPACLRRRLKAWLAPSEGPTRWVGGFRARGRGAAT